MTSQYRLINRMTGFYVGKMSMNPTSILSCLKCSFTDYIYFSNVLVGFARSAFSMVLAG
jgi:hypothetical protein